MSRLTALCLLIPVAWSAAVACASKHDRPANAQLNCEAGNCTPPPSGGGVGGKDGGTSDAPVDAPGGVVVAGSVKLITSDDFATAVPFPDPAKVEMEGATGLTVEGTYDGTAFSVSGVLSSPVVWATVTPSVATAMPTIQPAATDTGGDIELHVVQPSVIDTVYSLLTIPVTREVGAAHVVIRFLDATSGNPVTDIAVSHAGEVVAYDDGGSWSDVATGTGAAGYAVVVNVAPGAGPSKQKFVFTSGTLSGGVDLLVEPDAVTLADVLVTP
jgi:hypothetical protein